jgi:prepilin-type N-terminal cleavage/methylation domain-containing protein
VRSRHFAIPYTRRGFTLTEILIAVAVFALVMALLGLPLFSAFGYVQKASARSEAQRAGLQTAQQLSRELGVAMYIFELPPDGSWVAFAKEQTNDAERSRGMALGLDSGELVLCRYAQMPTFPWVWDYANATATTQSWVLMAPAYQSAPYAYEKNYAPFHDSGRQGLPPNPYVVTRLEEGNLSWAEASTYAADARYPLDLETQDLYTTAPVISRQTARDQLTRRLHNRLPSITPYGADTWDAPRFSVTPRRIPAETLATLKDADGQTDPTVMVAASPLIAGRSRDIDDLTDADLTLIYGESSATVRTLFPLYPVDRNPYGYQVRVFDGAGGLVYGSTSYDSATRKSRVVTSRHFMDWPRIDRPDWDAANPLWTPAEIARQRLEGKFVFAQPMRAGTLRLTTTAGNNPTATLPIPAPLNIGDYCGWIPPLTYLVTPPRKLTLQSGATTKSFVRVPSAAQLGPGKFYCPNLGTFDASSRLLEFGEPLADGDWDVVTSSGLATTTTYTICDLQPTDTVVVTYSTKAVLELSMSVSRKDNAARTPETSRQDFGVNMSIQASNAVKRARGDD